MADISAHDANEEHEKSQIRRFFNHKLGGVCVEVGANEPISVCSQSWHLEQTLDWQCVLIEPNPALAQKARLLRAQAIVCEAACTSPENVGTLTLNIPLDDYNQEITGHAGLEQNADEHDYQHHKTVAVQAKTLTELLQTNDIQAIDFLSIDVEGAEMEVLLGLDFSRYQPQLILLEDKHLYLKKHLFLRKKGYKVVQRLNRNCWYIPENLAAPPVSLLAKLKLLKRMFISIWVKKIHYAWRHKTLKPFQTL